MSLEEGLRALYLHCLELLRPKTEQLQNGRGDLRRLYGRGDIQPARRSWPCQQDGNVSILGVIASMLGDLALVAGVDHPVLSYTDDVRYSGITLRDPDELRRSHARVYLVKTGRLDGLAVDARRGIVVVGKELPRKFGGPNGPVVEPEDYAVVIDPKRDQGCRLRISLLLGGVPRSVESGDNFAIIDSVKGSAIHRRLPVFGRHGDSGAAEKSPAPESAQHFAEGSSTKSSALVKTGPGVAPSAR
jgi:hypothetical protein